MHAPNRRKLEIDRFFLVAFGRDVRTHDACPQSAYRDLETGALFFVYDSDQDGEMHYGVPREENQQMRGRVETEQKRYLEVPDFAHEKHEGILREFLRSDWTKDVRLRSDAQNRYRNSISEWITAMDCDADAVQSYNRFRDARLEQLAVEFLADHGINPVWR